MRTFKMSRLQRPRKIVPVPDATSDEARRARKEIAQVFERLGVDAVPLDVAAKMLPVLPEWREFRVRRG
jgi:hypothetical protein